jgi:hypothetical protein
MKLAPGQSQGQRSNNLYSQGQGHEVKIKGQTYLPKLITVALEVHQAKIKKLLDFLVVLFALSTSCLGFCVPILAIAVIILGSLYYGKEYCCDENIARLLIIGGIIQIIQILVELCESYAIQRQKFGKLRIPVEENGVSVLGLVEDKQSMIFKILSIITRSAFWIWFFIAAIVVFLVDGNVRMNVDKS